MRAVRPVDPKLPQHDDCLNFHTEAGWLAASNLWRRHRMRAGIAAAAAPQAAGEEGAPHFLLLSPCTRLVSSVASEAFHGDGNAKRTNDKTINRMPALIF